MAQRVGRGIAILFHDRGIRRGLVVSSMPRPHVTPGKEPVPIVQEAGWAPGPVWTDGKSRPRRDFFLLISNRYNVVHSGSCHFLIPPVLAHDSTSENPLWFF